MVLLWLGYLPPELRSYPKVSWTAYSLLCCFSSRRQGDQSTPAGLQPASTTLPVVEARMLLQQVPLVKVACSELQTQGFLCWLSLYFLPITPQIAHHCFSKSALCSQSFFFFFKKKQSKQTSKQRRHWGQPLALPSLPVPSEQFIAINYSIPVTWFIPPSSSHSDSKWSKLSNCMVASNSSCFSPILYVLV